MPSKNVFWNNSWGHLPEMLKWKSSSLPEKWKGEKSVFWVECSLNTGGSADGSVKPKFAGAPEKRVRCSLNKWNRKVQTGQFSCQTPESTAVWIHKPCCTSTMRPLGSVGSKQSSPGMNPRNRMLNQPRHIQWVTYCVIPSLQVHRQTKLTYFISSQER